MLVCCDMEISQQPKPTSPESIMELAKTGKIDEAYDELEKVLVQCEQNKTEVPEAYVSVHLTLLASEVASEKEPISAEPLP